MGAPIEGGREGWLRSVFSLPTSSYSSAEAAVTLAAAEGVSFDAVDDRLRHAPSALSPWYLHAVALLRGLGAVSNERVGALRTQSASAAAILK